MYIFSYTDFKNITFIYVYKIDFLEWNLPT